MLKSAPATWHGCLIFTRYGWKPAADAMRVSFAGYEDFLFFSHFVDGGYRVSEASTGLALIPDKDRGAKTSLTRGTAIGAAREWLARHSPALLQASIDRVLARRGGGRG